MELTARTLAELVKSLRSSEARGVEKRQMPRVGLRARAEIARHSDQARGIPIRVRDVSAGGVNFVCSEKFEAGEALVIVLGPSVGDMLPCTVRHCRRATDDLFVTGVKFDDYRPPRKRPA